MLGPAELCIKSEVVSAGAVAYWEPRLGHFGLVSTVVMKSRKLILKINVDLFPSLLQSQQKCIVIFALVCCFTVLVALMFSAVDFWGDDEDGITEENCSRNCR